MAQFKSFASQGNFSDFRIQIPDDSDKIMRQTEQQIADLKSIKAQNDANQRLIIEDAKAAQRIASDTRADNFQLQQQERRAAQRVMEMDYQTQINDQRQQAQAQQQVYKDLAQLSQTAFQLYNTVEDQYKKADLSRKNLIATKAGIDYNDLVSITKINEKLTRSQFNQVDLIQQKIKDGAPPEQIDALFKIYQSSGSRVWFKTAAIYQNTLNGLEGFSEAWRSENLPEDATYAQVDAALDAMTASYIDSNFAGARPEVLESTGVLKQLRQHVGALRDGYFKEDIKNKEAQLKAERLENLTSLYLSGDGGIERIHQEFQINPSKEKRQDTVEWMIKASKAGVISDDDIVTFLDKTYKFNGKDVKFKETYLEDAGKLRAALFDNRAAASAEERFDANQKIKYAESRLAQEFDQIVESQGYITEGQVKVLEEQWYASDGTDGRDSKVLEIARSLTSNKRATEMIDSRWTSRYERTGRLPTMEELNAIPLALPIKNKWKGLIRNYEADKPKLNDHEKAIRNQIKSHPTIQALGVGAAPGTVAIMEKRMLDEFRIEYKKLGNADEAAAVIINKIKTIQSNPAAVDANGDYVSIADDMKKELQQANLKYTQFKDFLQSLPTTPGASINYKEVANALSPVVVYQALDNLKVGKKVPAAVEYAAARLGTDSISLMNRIADVTGQERIELNTPWQQIKESLPPITRRLFDTFRTPERTNRGQRLMTGTVSQSNTRGSFNISTDVSRFRSAIIDQESGGSYSIVNPDSGAIGIGQVMPENVGPWTQRYVGRAMSPEEFRLSPGAQDAVVNGRFQDMLADQAAAGYSGEEMIRRAASIWYSGQGDLWNDTRPQYYNGRRYPSIAEYTQSIWNKFQNSY